VGFGVGVGPNPTPNPNPNPNPKLRDISESNPYLDYLKNNNSIKLRI